MLARQDTSTQLTHASYCDIRKMVNLEQLGLAWPELYTAGVQ